MIGVMHQLGELANQAHAIFAGLTDEAARSAQRVSNLHERLGAAAQQLSHVDNVIQSANPEELGEYCNARPGMVYTAEAEEQTGLFTAASRPHGLQAAFAAARPPPPLRRIARHLCDV
jgi:hypothetical protein